MAVTQYMNLRGIPTSSIAGIVLYGNPYFKGGAPQNKCSAVSSYLYLSFSIQSKWGAHQNPHELEIWARYCLCNRDSHTTSIFITCIWLLCHRWYDLSNHGFHGTASDVWWFQIRGGGHPICWRKIERSTWSCGRQEAWAASWRQ